MPGPFPGMDPYLEAPAGWPEVHNALMTAVRSLLNRTLPPRYVARIERYHVSLPIETSGVLGLRPDGGVYQNSGNSHAPDAGGTPAVVTGARTSVTPWVLVDASRSERLSRVVIESADDHSLITAVELLSPANKRAGQSRVAYTRKQVEYADRGVSLVEIDLLRRGRRSAFALRALSLLERDGIVPHYLALIRPAVRVASVVQPVRLEDVLPVVPVPLLDEDDDHPLDLQYCFDEQYDGGAYRRLNDYDRPPDPPLPDGHREWAADRVAAWREGREPAVPPPQIDAPPGGDGEPGAGP